MLLFLAAISLLALAPARAVEDKISHVNVLLPWRRRGASAPASATGGSSTSSRSPVEPTTQLLEAKPGCFRWESNSPDVAEVIPQYENDAEREAR